jgi:hypothetical protein
MGKLAGSLVLAATVAATPAVAVEAGALEASCTNEMRLGQAQDREIAVRANVERVAEYLEFHAGAVDDSGLTLTVLRSAGARSSN